MKANKLNRTQRIIRWASNKKTKSIGYAVTNLGYSSETGFMSLVNKLKRNGLITFTRTGQNIELHLTQGAYYNRKYFVV